MTKLKRPEREVPTTYRAVFNFETFRRLTFRERLAILFGWRNIEVLTTVQTQHASGKFRPDIVIRLTDKQAPEGGDEAYAGYLGTPIPMAGKTPDAPNP